MYTNTSLHKLILQKEYLLLFLAIHYKISRLHALLYLLVLTAFAAVLQLAVYMCSTYNALTIYIQYIIIKQIQYIIQTTFSGK